MIRRSIEFTVIAASAAGIGYFLFVAEPPAVETPEPAVVVAEPIPVPVDEKRERENARFMNQVKASFEREIERAEKEIGRQVEHEQRMQALRERQYR
ncbi:MAG TPA: hypothetical protein VM491_04685 [Burkholderiaceae bacterium]|nr:hypothetical protein [Burkholderiaceae bacterium]